MAVVSIPQLSATQSGQLALKETPAQAAVRAAAQAAVQPASAAVVIGPTGQPEIAKVGGGVLPLLKSKWVAYGAIGLGVLAAGMVILVVFG